MLLQLHFENFRSFRRKAVLDMTAAPLPEHREFLMGPDTDPVLKIAAIYGANAGGKTSVLAALHYMKELVTGMRTLDIGAYTDRYTAFEFDEKSRQSPSSFEVYFIAEGKEYRYGFQATHQAVSKEWLDLRDQEENRYSSLFARSGTGITCSDALAKARHYTDVSPNVLFLYFLSQTNLRAVKPVTDWFRGVSMLNWGDIRANDSIRTPAVLEMLQDSEIKSKVVRFFAAVDSGITDLRMGGAGGEKCDPETGIEQTPRPYKQLHRVYAIHRTAKGKEVQLPFACESEGMRRLFTLIRYILSVLDTGGVAAVDELSARLHPNLVAYILRLFHDSRTNPKGAQLIFTTHDTANLNARVFRRDEVWFAERGEEGESVLYSLADFRTEEFSPARSYQEDYLQGRFGAVPFFGPFIPAGSEERSENQE